MTPTQPWMLTKQNLLTRMAPWQKYPFALHWHIGPNGLEHPIALTARGATIPRPHGQMWLIDRLGQEMKDLWNTLSDNMGLPQCGEKPLTVFWIHMSRSGTGWNLIPAFGIADTTGQQHKVGSQTHTLQWTGNSAHAKLAWTHKTQNTKMDPIRLCEHYTFQEAQT